jgi:putative iron-dependent peroxidase
MITPQNGIFAQGTHSHYFLELDIQPGISAKSALASLASLREPEVSAGGVNFVIAFGPDFWSKIAPTQVPPDLAPFPAIKRPDGGPSPAAHHDVWLWFSGSTPDVVFDHARSAWLAVRDVAKLASEQPAFVYRDSRDMTGFIDGTQNPTPLEAPNVALIPTGQVGGGGSHVLVMRWVHNLDAFHALPVEEQERIIGRKKHNSDPLTKEERHPTGHLARVQIDDADGKEIEIYRRSVPYGTVKEHGLYFVAFSAEQKRFLLMLGNMSGSADGQHDRLTDFSKPVSAAFYFAPSLTTWRSCAA